MKNFLLLFLMFAASAVFAQNAPVNFESGGQGADWTWTVFENDANPPVEIIANPDASGINTSATVAKITALQTGNPWAGCESAHGSEDLGPFVLDATNSLVRIMVWKPVISDVGVKLVAASGWALPEIKVANTVVNQWEELTFDFSSYQNPPGGEGQYDQVVVFPDFDLAGRTQDNVVYFDNITFNPQGSSPDEPAVAAPTPPARDAGDVLSVFSEAYSSVSGTDFNPNWGQTTLVSVVEIEGDETLKYANFNYQGTQFASPLNATEMEYLHIDMWTANATSVNVFCISTGPVETPFSLPITPNQWVSYDIPLTAFSPVDMADLIQFKFDGGNSAVNIFLDNIYFYKEGGSPGGPSAAAPTPTEDPDDVISMFSDAYTDVPVDTWLTNWSAATLEDIAIDGNATKKYAQLDFAGIETVANQLDITEMTNFRMDVWSEDFTFFGVKLVDFGPDGAFGGGDDTEHQINFETPAQEEWISLDISLDDFAGLTGRENIAQLILVGQPTAANTVYVDNVYFYTDMGTGVDAAAPVQERLRLTPNPAKSGGQVQLSSVAAQIEVFDLAGKRILSSQNTAVINTNGMNAGTYIVSIRTLDGTTQTEKLVVN